MGNVKGMDSTLLFLCSLFIIRVSYLLIVSVMPSGAILISFLLGMLSHIQILSFFKFDSVKLKYDLILRSFLSLSWGIFMSFMFFVFIDMFVNVIDFIGLNTSYILTKSDVTFYTVGVPMSIIVGAFIHNEFLSEGRYN